MVISTPDPSGDCSEFDTYWAMNAYASSTLSPIFGYQQMVHGKLMVRTHLEKTQWRLDGLTVLSAYGSLYFQVKREHTVYILGPGIVICTNSRLI